MLGKITNKCWGRSKKLLEAVYIFVKTEKRLHLKLDFV